MKVIDLLTLTLRQLKNFYKAESIAIIQGNGVFVPEQGPLMIYLEKDKHWSIVSQDDKQTGRCLACVVGGEYVEPGKLKPSQAKVIGFKKQVLDQYNGLEKPVMTLEAELDGAAPKPNPFVPKLDESFTCNLVERLMCQGYLPLDYFKDDKELSSAIGVLSPGFRVISATKGPGSHRLYNEAGIAFDKIMQTIPYFERPMLMADGKGKYFWIPIDKFSPFLTGFFMPTHINYKVGANEVMMSVARLGSKVNYVFTKKRLELKTAYFY